MYIHNIHVAFSLIGRNTERFQFKELMVFANIKEIILQNDK